MRILIFILVSTVYFILSALRMLMLLRAVFSWLPTDQESKFSRFLYYSTEPVISPVRNLLERFRFFADFPIDLSFMIAYLLLTILSYLLPAVRI